MNKPNLATPFTPDYMRGFDEGQKHTAPSAETARRLGAIEQTIAEFPAFMQHVTDKLNEIKEDTGYTNGKVASLVAWQEQVKGAKQALGIVWMVLGVFVTAGIFTLFSMWSQLQQVDYRVEHPFNNVSK